MRRTLIILLLVATACARDGAPQPASSEPPLSIGRRVKVGYADSIVAAGGYVWMPTEEEGVVRVRIDTGEVIRSDNRPFERGPARAIVRLGGSLWYAVAGGTDPPGGLEGPCRDVRPIYEDFVLSTADFCNTSYSGPVVEVDVSSARLESEMVFLDHVPTSIAATRDHVWMTTDDGIRRFDPRSRVFDDVIVPGAWLDLIATETDLWAVGRRRVARIEPGTGRVAREIQLARVRHVALGAGSLWATTEGGVVRLDPQSLEERARIGVADAWGVAAGEGTVLVRVSSFDDGIEAVVRIDPARDAVVGRLEFDGGDYDSTNSIVVAGGHGWTFRNAYELVRIDWER